MVAIYGHRGARGLFPENTLEGIESTLLLPVDGIEIDIVVSKDNQLIVSHNPFAEHQFCLDPKGNEIKQEDELSHNFHQMNYEDILRYDVGSKVVPRFLYQEKFQVKIPLLSKVFELLNQKTTADFTFFLEVKSEEKMYGEYYPYPEEYAQLVFDFLEKNKIEGQLIVKSFDPKFMNAFHKIAGKKYSLGLLVENKLSLEENLNRLEFVPEFYNPDFCLVTARLSTELQEKGIKLVSWTINEEEEIEQIRKVGGYGIITDYPNKFVNNLGIS